MHYTKERFRPFLFVEAGMTVRREKKAATERSNE